MAEGCLERIIKKRVIIKIEHTLLQEFIIILLAVLSYQLLQTVDVLMNTQNQIHIDI